jgi:hypothetical protein
VMSLAAFPVVVCRVSKREEECSGSRKLGRRRGQRNITAIQSCERTVNRSAHERHPSYSRAQLYYECSCRPATKHVVYRVRSANHSATALRCRVCSGEGSKWEQHLYCTLDKEDSVVLYAVEACSVAEPAEPIMCDNVRVHPRRNGGMQQLLLLVACD